MRHFQINIENVQQKNSIQWVSKTLRKDFPWYNYEPLKLSKGFFIYIPIEVRVLKVNKSISILLIEKVKVKLRKKIDIGRNFKAIK